MKNIHTGKLASLACLLVAALHMGPAAAHLIYFCTATNTAPNATVGENLEVQSGATCTLSGAKVEGNVTADEGSTLIIENNSQILGSLTINAANFYVAGSTIWGPTVVAQTAGTRTATPIGLEFLCGNTINGSVTIASEGAEPNAPNYVIYLGSTNSGACAGNTVHGSVSVLANAVPVVVEANTVVSPVTVLDNTATPTSVWVIDNVISGALKCSANVALLGIGTNNVKGPETDQCAGF